MITMMHVLRTKEDKDKTIQHLEEQLKLTEQRVVELEMQADEVSAL